MKLPMAYLGNMGNQLASILDESSKRKTANVLCFQLQQVKAPKQNENPSGLEYYSKEGIKKRKNS